MLSLTDDIAARFEAGADRSVGGGRAQHPVDRQGNWGPAADCQPLARSGFKRAADTSIGLAAYPSDLNLNGIYRPRLFGLVPNDMRQSSFGDFAQPSIFSQIHQEQSV